MTRLLLLVIVGVASSFLGYCLAVGFLTTWDRLMTPLRRAILRAERDARAPHQTETPEP